MMTGVLDNLASIHKLLGVEMPVIGPTVVARSAIEIASGACVHHGVVAVDV